MSKTKFRFNTETLEYEKVKTKNWVIMARVLGYLSLIAVIFFSGVSLSYKLVSSPNEKKLQSKVNDYEVQMKVLNEKAELVDEQLLQLISQDEEVYREIFGADPIPSELREGGTGGTDKYKALDAFKNGSTLKALHQKLDKLQAQMKVQDNSYAELKKLAKAKQHMLASIPAIQPVAQ